MIYTAHIHLWDSLVGAIAWNEESKVSAFEFDPDFLKNKWNISPIKLPLGNAKDQVFTFNDLRATNFLGLPGFLGDMLPGKFAQSLISYWLIHQKKEDAAFNAIQYLNFIGRRGVGALEIEPAIGGSGSVTSNIDVEALQRIVDLFEQNKGAVNIEKNTIDEQIFFELLKISSSTTHDSPAAFIAYNEDTEEVRSGQFYAPDNFEHFILHFNNNQLSLQANIEARIRMALYNMAKEVSIDVPYCRLLEAENDSFFITKRVDRANKLDRILTQSLSGLCHYTSHNAYSYEQVFEAMRLLRLPYAAAEQMFRRVVFNIVVNNKSENVKSICFLMDKDEGWKLAPYSPMEVSQKFINRGNHTLSLNDKNREINRKDLHELALQMSIKKSESIIEEIVEVAANWKYYAENQEVEDKYIDEIAQSFNIV